ncbi:hypothetical protein HanXRQr2_Chr16g0777201 [Helianthus annuus]|uniref:Uncharacterized protein n=1 Tax=Helianthus annuus TaxID=4232 RepID=A0A251S2E0_HELAN|nr:hypothetical protein HanXRQr2_Chr16g0777201 [Helianthus annuus]KAJ0445526.1 hypothetical protein HanIR_Chr16g0843921 [Helianthus annuus]KAJ0823594.1 hypothetical protein HanPSC8_Chr16g0745541 [Helianthus annuus]
MGQAQPNSLTPKTLPYKYISNSHPLIESLAPSPFTNLFLLPALVRRPVSPAGSRQPDILFPANTAHTLATFHLVPSYTPLLYPCN